MRDGGVTSLWMGSWDVSYGCRGAAIRLRDRTCLWTLDFENVRTLWRAILDFMRTAK